MECVGLMMPQIEARLFGTPPKKAPFWRSWLAGGVVAAALAGLVVAVLPMLQPPSVVEAPVTVAVLSAEAQDLRFEVARSGDQLTITRVSGAAPETGTSHELWLIAYKAAPVSLGLLDAGTETVSVPALASGMVFADRKSVV